jgi:hypothetical protein
MKARIVSNDLHAYKTIEVLLMQTLDSMRPQSVNLSYEHSSIGAGVSPTN